MTRLLTCFFLLLTNCAFAQEAVKLTFDRPSVTEVFLRSGVNYSSQIYTSGREDYKLMDNRADNNNLGYSSIQSLDEVQSISDKTLSFIWNRDNLGNFSDSIINYRGSYTATDNEFLADNASQISRLGELGYRLLNKAYIFVYEITSVVDMETIYDEQDNEKRQRIAEYNSNRKEGKPAKEFKPVMRIAQGYQVGFNVIIYRINWNDSIQSYFFNELWVDQGTTENRRSRIQKFNSWNVPFTEVYKYSSMFNQTTVKSAEEQPDPEILSAMLSRVDRSMRSQAMSGVSEIIPDFKVRANVSSAYPILAKLGKKESLRMEDRYFIYELSKDTSGEIVRTLKGWANVGIIRNNKKMANGEMKQSVFIQHGGQKVFDGMIIEEENDAGVVAQLGLGVNNPYYNGLSLGLEFNTTKIDVTRFFGLPISTRNILLPGVYVGANLNWGYGFKQKMGNIFAEAYAPDSNFPNLTTNILTNSSDLYNTWSAGIELFIGKEFYVTRTGSFYLYPKAGVNISFFNITRENGEPIHKISDDTSPFSRGSIGGYYSLNIGYNFSPDITYFLEPMFFSTPQFFYGAQQLDPSGASKFYSNLSNNPVFVRCGVRMRI